MTIGAFDALERPRTAGGDVFTVRFQGPSSDVDHKLEDHGNGTYTLTCFLPASGIYGLRITLGSVPIKGSPFSVSCRSQKGAVVYTRACKEEGHEKAPEGLCIDCQYARLASRCFFTAC